MDISDATSSADNLLTPKAALKGHTGEINCLHAPGDGRLASGGSDGAVRLWDLAAGRTARALLLPAADGAGGVNAVCAGASGTAASWVYAAAATHVYGWDLRAPGVIVREPACAFNHLAHDEVGHLALHEESGALAAADDAGDVHIVDVGSMAAAPGATSGAIVALRGGHTSICTWVAFRPGPASRECCTAGLDARCVRWDWRVAAQLEAWPLATAGSPFAAALAAAHAPAPSGGGPSSAVRRSGAQPAPAAPPAAPPGHAACGR